MKRRLIFPKLNQTMNLAKFSVTTGIIGDALNSSALKSASTQSAAYIGPMVNLSMAGMMLKKLPKRKK